MRLLLVEHNNTIIFKYSRGFKQMSFLAKKYSLIPTIQLPTGVSYSHPSLSALLLHLEDPALEAMQDLQKANAFTILGSAPISEAELEMKVSHSHLLLVVDETEAVVGLLASEDLLGERPLRVAKERKIKRAEILVRMVMTPREKIIVFPLDELKYAKVGQVVNTLHHLHQHYALVIEELSPEKKNVRGFFSLHQISKQLGQDVTFDLTEAHSLYELHQDRKGP